MTKRLIRISGQGVDKVFDAMFVQNISYRNYVKLTSDDVVIFEGGTDVSPDLYGEQRGKHTCVPDSTRDAFERNIFEEAQEAGAYCVGVCRGAQFLTVMCGGSLIQHVEGHGHGHLMATNDGRTIPVTSTHHQMMAPGNVDHELVGWSLKNRSDVYLDGNNKDCFHKLDSDMGLEPEIVWYPKHRCLAIQGHPEYQNFYAAFPSFCREFVRKHIFYNGV